ncbi:MAG: hypothetical protein A2268_06570 [Candidatus Raymondbacteria bacterium RifOxyA12_full_50_37]|uniref:Uncharacterized protein n=1 Tax=Candidatus Raymondbacteria bacterium RIFOXYD12_FULL_49_13 TaxID=1817890 RepID=A0A1F7EZD6_UNCRA|nr:MAG: hypothetical protein A2350_02390 [Candidatus Raymondbacteria bacterium RifOxyB12_full_50_8]OGJ92190.1 MAG: hypothetical protein A2268_06570 [Candidatus Raymondbacteria bacterium RifOxyA12_full_50_37]OGJ94227.1 MAG: hypothetical protein A2487_17395 [Candidatus Raymondbacteria bacterium RifOxyC12_full_50_8]OGJ94473.1 MAG: hypothetical protein A2248_15500 [Candidatus Raymondbacteria bacterium RIFOXYA2_FULL_49_16]OGJ99229.1 MAG: hypothetical protein A2453_07350 [Candidatus Raymondbacteria b
MSWELLGKLCKAAYEVFFEAMAAEVGDDVVFPGMVAAVQTFGDLSRTGERTFQVRQSKKFPNI